MSELIERAAKALFDDLLANDGPWALAMGDGPSAVTLDGTFDLRDMVRVVIKALREPSEAMLNACKPPNEVPLGPWREYAEDDWRRMIDEALR